MKIGIVLFLSALILTAAMLKAGTESPEGQDIDKPEIKNQEETRPDNKPIFEEDYEKAVSHGERNVLVIFGAEWCKYCKILKNDMPIMNLDGYVICYVDVTKNKDLKVRKGISSLPTSMIIDQGREVSRKVGYLEQEYKDWLESNRRMAK